MLNVKWLLVLVGGWWVIVLFFFSNALFFYNVLYRIFTKVILFFQFMQNFGIGIFWAVGFKPCIYHSLCRKAFIINIQIFMLQTGKVVLLSSGLG